MGRRRIGVAACPRAPAWFSRPLLAPKRMPGRTGGRLSTSREAVPGLRGDMHGAVWGGGGRGEASQRFPRAAPGKRKRRSWGNEPVDNRAVAPRCPSPKHAAAPPGGSARPRATQGTFAIPNLPAARKDGDS